jgi:glycosyltransferase involved in cell wall biosynthesis
MKILHVAITKGWNAASQAAFLVMQEQLRRGDGVAAYVLRGSQLHQRLAALPVAPRFHFQIRHQDPAAFFRLRGILRRDAVDVVHTHRSQATLATVLAARSLGRAIPVIHMSRDRPTGWSALARLRYGLMDRIVVPNRHVQTLFSVAGGRGLPFVIVPFPVAPFPAPAEPTAAPAARGAEPLRIGLLARYDPIKGHHFLLQAAGRLLGKPGVPPFVLVFSGLRKNAYKSAIAAEAEALGLAPHIAWPPDGGPVLAVLNSLDIGVVCSIGSEEVSRIALEYMAAGVPVVATAVGGLPEMVGAGEGRLVPAATLRELLVDPALRARLGAGGRARVQAEFDVRVVCERLAAIYREALAARGIRSDGHHR